MRKRNQEPPLPTQQDLAEAIKEAKELNEAEYLVGSTYNGVISLLGSALRNPRRLKEVNLQKAAKVAKIILELRSVLAKALEKRGELLELLNEGSTSGWRNRVITDEPKPPAPGAPTENPKDPI